MAASVQARFDTDWVEPDTDWHVEPDSGGGVLADETKEQSRVDTETCHQCGRDFTCVTIHWAQPSTGCTYPDIEPTRQSILLGIVLSGHGRLQDSGKGNTYLRAWDDGEGKMLDWLNTRLEWLSRLRGKQLYTRSHPTITALSKQARHTVDPTALLVWYLLTGQRYADGSISVTVKDSPVTAKRAFRQSGLPTPHVRSLADGFELEFGPSDARDLYGYVTKSPLWSKRPGCTDELFPSKAGFDWQ